jgi:hypothetical protein
MSAYDLGRISANDFLGRGLERESTLRRPPATELSVPFPYGSPGFPGTPFGLSSRDGVTTTSSIACGAGVRSRRATFVDHAGSG